MKLNRQSRRNNTYGRKTPEPPLVRNEDFVRLKDRLLVEALRETDHPTLRERFQWAAQDAAALAYATPWPALFFPVLFAEKKAAAQQWLLRQEAINRRSL